ncbi:MAG: hypothetical protein ACYC7D_13105 [Nitrososphaerales archaeon]
MADYVFLTLLVIHVGAVVAWAGSALFGNMVLLPLLPKLSPGGRSDVGRLLIPKMFRYGLVMGIVALADGAVLYYYITFVGPKSEATSVLGDPYIRGGALLGLLVLIIFTWFQNGTMKKMGKISAQLAQSAPGQAGNPLMAQMTALQKRSAMVSRIAAGVLVLIIILMLVGANI